MKLIIRCISLLIFMIILQPQLVFAVGSRAYARDDGGVATGHSGVAEGHGGVATGHSGVAVRHNRSNTVITRRAVIPRLDRGIHQATTKPKKKILAKKRHHTKKHFAKSKAKRSPTVSPDVMAKLSEPSLNDNLHKRSFASSFSSVKQKVVSFVHQTVESMNYSHYKLGGKRFDTSRGIYVLDCSDYVDNILQSANPHAYTNLVNATGTEKPTSRDYYDFFSGLSGKNYYWNRIAEVESLQPGDILVFRSKKRMRSGATGHVMIVMNKPSPIEDAYLVRVADSAPVGHSQDTRQANASGIGIGTLLLKADSETGEPAAYAWKVGSRWKNNVHFAMARPTGVY